MVDSKDRSNVWHKFVGNGKKEVPWEKILRADDQILKDGRPDDLIIPVLGLTGAGKSTLINALLGRTVMKVSDYLESCTEKPQYAIIEIRETPLAARYPSHAHRRIVLLDTPGFGDNRMPENEILRMISIWLAHSYNMEITVAGLVYLFDSTAKRLTMAGSNGITLLTKLCGKKALQRVIVGVTQWENIPSPLEKRMDNLVKFWDPTIVKAGHVIPIRSPGTDKASTNPSSEKYPPKYPWEAIDVLVESALCDEQKGVLSLRIQKELVDNKEEYQATAAARFLRKTLEELLKEYERPELASTEVSQKEQSIRQQLKDLENQNTVPRFSKRLKTTFGLN